MTYGWALLVIVIVIAVLLLINPFSAPEGCRFDQVGFTCTKPVIKAAAGGLFTAITNGNNNDVNIYKAVCTSDKSSVAPASLTGGSAALVPRQSVYSINSTNVVSCSGGAAMTAGSEFTGKVWILYTNTEDPADYPKRVASANIVAKVAQ